MVEEKKERKISPTQRVIDAKDQHLAIKEAEAIIKAKGMLGPPGGEIESVNVKLADKNYNDTFYNSIVRKYSEFSVVMVQAILDCFEIKTVVDVGCGIGLYLKAFADISGATVKGFELSQYAIDHALIDSSDIMSHDLSLPLFPHKRYDCCISFEVAEHIDKAHAGIFVRNLTLLSDVVIFSAAKPGQGGTDHVNCQDEEYWIDIFGFTGYDYSEADVFRIKHKIEESGIELKDMFPYENLMVFLKKEV